MTDGDESIGLAGWLFADLLLALMFVFLAIGFVIEADTERQRVQMRNGSHIEGIMKGYKEIKQC